MTTPIYGLTPAQADCARVIAALTTFEGNSPSYKKIAAELGIYQSQACGLVGRLIDRGWIARPARFAWRALRLTRSPPPFDYGAIDVTEAGRAYLEQAA